MCQQYVEQCNCGSMSLREGVYERGVYEWLFEKDVEGGGQEMEEN
jgi:hypothetical protein